jgi:hypothetical protein
MAGDSAQTGGPLVGQLKLFFGQTVHALDFLLLPELQAVVADLAPASLAMLARGEGSSFHGALIAEATVALEV